jgi:hypothetical protein
MIGFTKEQLFEFMRERPRDVDSHDLKPFFLATLLDNAVKNSGGSFTISSSRGNSSGKQYPVTGFSAVIVKEERKPEGYQLNVQVDDIDLSGLAGFFSNYRGGFVVDTPMSEFVQDRQDQRRDHRNDTFEFNITAQLLLLPLLIEFEVLWAEYWLAGMGYKTSEAKKLTEHQIYFLDRDNDGAPWSFGEPVMLVKQIDGVHIEHGSICDCYTSDNRWFHSSNLYTVDQLLTIRSQPFRSASRPDRDRTPPPPIFNQVIGAYKAAVAVKEGPKE